MERVIINHKIQTYLSRLDDQLILANKNGEGNLAKACESLVRELFSVIYDKTFINANLGISNFPAIDLHVPEERIALQVTSNRANEKVLDCFDKFFKYGLHKNYDKLYIIILGNKRHDLPKIAKSYSQIEAKYGVNFTLEISKSIVDLSALYNIISQNLSFQKVNDVLHLLISYFEEFKSIVSMTSYHEDLKTRFFEVVMDDPKGLTLNSIYVDPEFLIHKTSANPISKKIKDVYEGYTPLKEISIHNLLTSRFSGDDIYNDMFTAPEAKVIFILGYPGQGKTSLCSKFLFDQLTLPIAKNIFYLKLRNISDTKALIHNPFNVICNELENQFGSGFDSSLLKKSITVLDGLDELFMKDNLSANDIEIFCKDLIREASKHEDWQIIVTTRHGYVNFDRLYRESYIALILKPLDPLRQRLWINAYQSFYPESWLTVAKLKEFYEKKFEGRRNHILELIDQPLLLYIVASLENEIAIDSNRSEIYNKLFDQIIERRYSHDGQIENLKTLSKDNLRSMLQEIAFLIFISGKEYVTTSEILKNEEMQPYLDKIGDNHLSGTLKGILISFYFKERMEDVQKDEPAGIEFFHKSLQEYLTAEKLVNLIFKKLLNKDQHGDYILTRNDDFLTLLNDIFGKMAIRSEIRGFIKELILKKNLNERSELAERLSKPLNYLFKKDFLLEVRKEDSEPLDKAMCTFISYWHFLHSLAERKNYLTSESLSMKFNSYLKLIETSEKIQVEEKWVNYQKFVKIDIKGWFLMEDELLSTAFVNCTIDDMALYDSEVCDTTFIDCDIHSLRIDECKIIGLEFNGCHLYEFKLNDSKINKIIFKDSEIHGEINLRKTTKKNVIFDNTIFYEEAYLSLIENLSEVKLVNCSLRKLIKKKGKYTSGNVDTLIANN